MIFPTAFPTTIVDNFYKNPDKIREYALSLEYDYTPKGRAAGKITKSLGTLNKDFADYSVSRFLNLFFDYNTTEVEWQVDTFFSLIDPYSNNENSSLNKSWVHMDLGDVLAGIIYLNPDANLNSGTSVYKPIRLLTVEETNNPERRDLHLGKPVELNLYTEAQVKHNSNFEETISIKNVYNRLVSYDANSWHCANNYWTYNVPRLTQVFFISKLTLSNTAPPLTRLNDFPDFDGDLK